MTAKDLVMYFANKWSEKHGRPYTIAFSKEVPMLKRLQTYHSDADLKKFIDYYLFAFNDKYCGATHYPLRLFVSSINAIAGQVVADDIAKAKASPSSDAERIEEARRKT